MKLTKILQNPINDSKGYDRRNTDEDYRQIILLRDRIVAYMWDDYEQFA